MTSVINFVTTSFTLFLYFNEILVQNYKSISFLKFGILATNKFGISAKVMSCEFVSALNILGRVLEHMMVCIVGLPITWPVLEYSFVWWSYIELSFLGFN